MNSDKYLLIILGSGTIIYSVYSRLSQPKRLGRTQFQTEMTYVPTFVEPTKTPTFVEPTKTPAQDFANEGEIVPKELINEVFEDNLQARGKGMVYPEPAKKPEFPKNYFASKDFEELAKMQEQEIHPEPPKIKTQEPPYTMSGAYKIVSELPMYQSIYLF